MGSYKNEESEVQRLGALHQYNILDSLTEQDYEDITKMASIICNVPISLISFVDEGRQWFKSHRGLDVSETAREYSFCSHALASPEEYLVVKDSRYDKRFHDNPLVTGDPHIVFYAGIPLINSEGFGLGTVCVIDTKPRELTADQIAALKILASQVINLLEMRKANADLQLLKLELETRNKSLEQYAMVVSHDIKSPLTSVILANQVLQSNFAEKLGVDGMKFVNTSNNAVDKIRNLVDGILSYYKGDHNISNRESFKLIEFFERITQVLTFPKAFNIIYDIPDVEIFMNKIQLEQVFLNLIANGIRYNDKPVAEIMLGFSEQQDYYHFSVTDNGIGIPEIHQRDIFNLFATVSRTDFFGIKSHGIGLASVKKIVENHEGSITLDSTSGIGSTFTFTIKKTV